VKPFWGLIRKHLHDTRGTMLLSAGALFGLGWLFVFVTSRFEAEILKALGTNTDTMEGRIEMMRSLGVMEDSASVSIMMTFWNHPFIVLTMAIWAISRGSIAVSGEIERGTMDLILSRPIARSSYLASHVLIGVLGLCLLALALSVGAAVGLNFNHLRVPPSFSTLFRPALNLAALGLPVYGYTLLVSSLDQVRWRPTMIGSVLTLLGFIAWVVSMIPVLRDYSWRVWLERISIFKLYNPVDAVGPAEHLGRDLAILAGLGAAFIVLAFVGFIRRDLPANS
jgi:ABC-2 type transport system permease protein